MSRPDPGEDPRLSEGLERLRALGYLRSPAELFVAGQVSARGGILRTAFISGAWIGGGGGLLAGLVLAISFLVAVPGLLSQPSEFLSLGLDLVLVSAVAAAILVTLLTLVILSVMRRRQTAWRAGAERWLLLLATLPPSLYLADVFARFLLYRVHGWRWFLAAFLAAAVAALLAGAWGRVLRALLAAAGLAPTETTGLGVLRGIRIQTRMILLLVTFMALVVGPYRQMRALPRLDQVAPPHTAAPSETLLILTVDGISGETLRGEIGASETPRTLEGPGLMEHPAVFWNSLATGFGAHAHGLESASDYAPSGVSRGLEEAMRQPVLAVVLRIVLPGLGLAELRALDQRELLRPPYWEIAARCGRPVSVINAWATYPAAQHPELSVVSDRCFLRMWEGESVDADSHLTHPLRAGLLQTAQAALERRGEFPSVVTGDSLLATTPLYGLEDVREAWGFAVGADLFHASLAEQDLRDGSYSCVAAHLGGADVLVRAVNRAPAGTTQVLGERLIRLHARFVGDLVAQLCHGSGDEASWVVVASTLSAGGREASVLASESPRMGRILQFAPEVLWRLAIPPARDMDTEMLTLPPSWVRPDTWGRRANWTPAAERSAADLERLRSLGYIGGS
jgi:hypothetical protein